MLQNKNLISNKFNTNNDNLRNYFNFKITDNKEITMIIQKTLGCYSMLTQQIGQ